MHIWTCNSKLLTSDDTAIKVYGWDIVILKFPMDKCGNSCYGCLLMGNQCFYQIRLLKDGE